MEPSMSDAGDTRKYRTEIPNMADDDLDPYQYRLYAHYKRVCGADGGECYESVRTTAEKTKMSNEKVIETRAWLAENGWIALQQGAKGVFKITIVERWNENFVRYSERSTVRNSEQSTPSSLEIPNSTVRNSERSPLEISNQRKNLLKKEPIKNNSATRQSPAATDGQPKVKQTDPLIKPIMDAYVELRGKNGVNYGKEGAWAKKIAKEHPDRTVEKVEACYQWLKQDKFYEFKPVSLAKIYESMPEFLRYIDKRGGLKPKPPPEQGGVIMIRNSITGKLEERHVNT